MIRADRVASHTMAAVGLASLASTGQIALPLLGVGVAALLVSLGLDMARKAGTPPPWLANALIVAALGFAVVDYLWIAPTLLHVGAHLLVVLMLTRLRHTDAREYLQLAVIVFLQVLTTAGLTSRSAFAAWFVTYLVVMVWVLMQHHLMEETERFGISVSHGPIAERFGWWPLAASGAALVVTGTLFVFLPRMGFGLLAGSQGPDIQISGFSPHVTLGALGPLKRDPTVVMRVSAGEGAIGGELLYLRGAAFDAYDGRNWLNTSPIRRLVPLDEEGRFAIGRVPPRSTVYSVRLEPIDSPVLFTPDRTMAIEGPFSTVSVDDEQTFGVPYARRGRVSYEIWRRPAGDASVQSHESPARLARSLSFDGSAAIVKLAREAAGSSAAPSDRATAVEQFLKSHYAYTLDVPGGEDRPLEEFLFQRRSGFCEHFASAMVLMLRAIDIPARLVNGFLVQEWNEYGEYFIVRQGDAHAWVEAYLPGRGWTRFDPTPSVPASDRPWEGRLPHSLDALRAAWDRYVVEFGLGDQHAAIQRLETAWDETRRELSASLEAAVTSWNAVRDALPGAWVRVALGIAMAAVIVGLATRHRPWRRWFGAPPVAPRVEFYGRLLATLSRRGIAKPPGATPWEFATRDAARFPWANEIRQVTTYYYTVRYGRRSLNSVERLAVATALATIERSTIRVNVAKSG
ncbi:MAG: DUF3488 domain-containing protein [Nitrospirae bacterium]|nr:DUF3488 domain-containing protein [Nitrospirota bacterium]